MTPEEQFIKIENTLQHVVEMQAKQAEDVARHQGEIDKVTAAVRDLVIVSRTILDAQKATDARVSGLVDAGNRVDERIAKLGERVDQFEEDRRRSNAEFDAKFGALIQAQMETERKLQAWIDRQRNGH